MDTADRDICGKSDDLLCFILLEFISCLVPKKIEDSNSCLPGNIFVLIWGILMVM